MDMSFSLADAVPLAPPPLDFDRLMASRQVSTPALLGRLDNPFEHASSVHRLAAVVLNRHGWEQAARALHGRFADIRLAGREAWPSL